MLGEHSGQEGTLFVAPGISIQDTTRQKWQEAKDNNLPATLKALSAPYEALEFLKENMAPGGTITFAQCTLPGPKLQALRQDITGVLGADINVEIFDGSAGFYYGYPYPKLSYLERLGLKYRDHPNSDWISKTTK